MVMMMPQQFNMYPQFSSINVKIVLSLTATYLANPRRKVDTGSDQSMNQQLNQ